MRIAVSTRIVDAVGYSEPRDALSHDWQVWLEERDHDLFLMPNASRMPERYLDLVAAEAVIFTGGNDLVPRGGDSSLSEVRNASERRILQAAIDKNIPVLGVCRGLHLINDYFGGAVDPDVSASEVNHVASVHEVLLEGPIAALATDPVISINSYHNQGIREDGLSSELVAFAWSSKDRLVEGVMHPVKPILAMQWHPERESPSADFDTALIARFLEKGAFWVQ